MTTTFILASVLSLLIGLSLGLLGGGGSILTVPVLIYVLAVQPKSAIAMSLFVVGLTSGVAMLVHARRGHVSFRAGMLFGAASMAGAFAGGRVAHFIPDAILLLGFGLMMLAAAAAMLRKRKGADQGSEPPRAAPITKTALIGTAAGFATGLVGAGGGFIVVPALVLLVGLPVRTAIGTSLLVIMMSSIAAFAGYLGHVTIDWTIAAVVTAFAVLGSLAGGALAARIPQDALRTGFAWFVVAMGVFVLSRQIPAIAASAGLRQIPWHAVLPVLAAAVFAGFLAFTRRGATCHF
jgi:uncharacterized membrane protein YfcA